MANNPIKYGLRENLLTADPDDCMAQVVDARSYSQEDIAAGEFSVDVRTKIIGSSGKALKTMKKGTYGKVLAAIKA